MASELENASAQVIVDAGLLHDIVNGADDATVTLATGIVVNTVAKELKSLSSGLSATATSIAAGQSATATYDPALKKFTFGIPVGATGAQGAQGATGAAGQDGEMLGANNLSEITDPAIARANLGISGGGFKAPDVICGEYASSYSNGGSSVAGTQSRILSSFRRNTLSATVTNSKLSLPAGDYYFEATAPAYASNQHIAYLQRLSSADVQLEKIVGSAEYSHSVGYDGVTRSKIVGVVTVAAGETLRIRHYTSAAKPTYGLGYASSNQENKYAEIRLWKL